MVELKGAVAKVPQNRTNGDIPKLQVGAGGVVYIGWQTAGVVGGMIPQMVQIIPANVALDGHLSWQSAGRRTHHPHGVEVRPRDGVREQAEQSRSGTSHEHRRGDLVKTYQW